MSLYRVMVSAEEEYWDVLDIEADTEEEAKMKALKKASGWQRKAWTNRTGLSHIQVEGIELLEEDVPKSSDLAWVEGITSEGD
jgi:hypothetical protein